MIDPDCKVCLSIGWVCENHPQRAWTDELGCQCGAGMPCECVRTDGLDAGHREELRSHSPILDANWRIHLLQKMAGGSLFGLGKDRNVRLARPSEMSAHGTIDVIRPTDT